MAGRQTKGEKEREKAVQDRVQAVLGAMLKDEDNKYCIDCDSKGPRWCSWNLGIFLCIRCAGIHRNLGVHISKVKSVNLDSWTPQQVASMQQMGNCRGRAVYEASLPEDFRRPQTDSAVEAFVRQKYEKKKYLQTNWSPTKPPEFPVGWDGGEDALAAGSKAKPEVTKKVVLPARSPTAPVTSRPAPKASPQPPRPVTAPSLPSSASTDLLGLLSSPSPPAPSTALPASASSDLLGLQAEFGDFTSASPAAAAPQAPASNADLFANTTAAPTPDAGKMSTDSIMALFGPTSTSSQPQMFSSPQQQQQLGGLGQQLGGLGQQLGGLGGLLSAPGGFNPTPHPQQAPANNPFLTDSGLLGGQLSGLNLGQGQASLWQ